MRQIFLDTLQTSKHYLPPFGKLFLKYSTFNVFTVDPAIRCQGTIMAKIQKTILIYIVFSLLLLLLLFLSLLRPSSPFSPLSLSPPFSFSSSLFFFTMLLLLFQKNLIAMV